MSRLRDENRKLRDDRRDFERDIERVRSNVKTEKEQLERDRRELKKLIEGSGFEIYSNFSCINGLFEFSIVY